MSKQKLLLIDGNSILNRAYFAMPMMNDSEGRNVNAVYGFVNILLKVLQDHSPDKLVVAFDLRGKNFRKEIYPEYKANRTGMPDDLAAQMPILHELLAAMKITVVEKGGVEADDIIGTISSAFDGYSYIVSGDRDMFQLVSDRVTVLFTKRGVTDVEVVTPQSLMANYSLTPEQVIEYKALRGDTSDNIPGVKGVGEKTAMQLLSKYGDIDTLYLNVEKEKGALKEKLIANKDMAYISKTLATIIKNADVQFDLDDCGLYELGADVHEMLTKLQFRSVIARLQFDTEVAQASKVEVTAENIASVAELDKVVDLMRKSDYFSFYMTDNYVALSNDVAKEYVVTPSDSFLDELTVQTTFEHLQSLLASSTPKSVYDYKTTRRNLAKLGVELRSVKYDVCLMQYLIESRTYKDATSLCDAYGYDRIAAGLFALSARYEDKLSELNMKSLYYDIELPLSDLLFRMEEEGVKVDEQLLDKMSGEMRLQLDEITQEIYRLADEQFNINSPMQLSKILFEKLNLPHGKKTHREYYTTNNEVLEKIVDKHPVVPKILEHRKLAKLLNTYVDGLKPLLRHGLVHTTYNQALTATGRLSSSDPNLQNIPIRNELGKEIRKLFVSKYGVFVGADYSQIELRLLAAFSMDDNLLDSFKKGEDIHARVASELMGIPPQMVNHDMRRMAKAVNFGIIYGISDYGLAQNVNLSVKKARDYIQLYFERFPKIKSYLDGCIASAKQDGYAVTYSGRRRYIPELKSSNFNLRSFGERVAMNMPLQGSAADIMKIAMLNVDKAIRSAELRSKIVLQIHDELIVDCFPDEVEQIKAIIAEQMENAVALACPLTVEVGEGVDLYEE